MAEYKYTIEVTLRSEVPKSNAPNVPQLSPNPAINIANLMPLLAEIAKNIQVKQIPSEKEEVEKK